jgi:hypothetical protein
MPPKIVRALVSAAAGVALAGALAAAPAQAADGPVIVDGVKRDGAQLKGKTLFVVDAKPGKPAIAFTHKKEFRAYVRKHLGVDLTKKPRSASKPTAKASWTGDYATFFTDANGYGANFNVNSGYGLSNFYSLNCFLWWCTNFDDQVSSVYTHGVPAILYSETGYRGSTYFIGANQHANIPWWFNDISSSAYVYWS